MSLDHWRFLEPVRRAANSRAPLLAITLTSTNTVMVSWLSPSLGFNSQQNTNGLDTANWSNVLTAPFDNGVIKYLIVNTPTGTRFFRLTKP